MNPVAPFRASTERGSLHCPHGIPKRPMTVAITTTMAGESDALPSINVAMFSRRSLRRKAARGILVELHGS